MPFERDADLPARASDDGAQSESHDAGDDTNPVVLNPVSDAEIATHRLERELSALADLVRSLHARLEVVEEQLHEVARR